MKTASTAPAPIASSPTTSDPASPSGVPLIIPAKTSRLENGVSRKEEKAPQGQISRIATTFPADTSSPRSPQPEKPSVAELRRGIIRIDAVSPDGNPRSLIILTGLKNLFQKQLPKMPREYIARLVYDQNSRALAIVKRGWKVVGGILFRPFPHRNFAEIVFFATASVDQVKGYGGMLMNHFKAHIKKTYPGMLHFLTYADNYAVGYFKKQGFTKEITLDRSVWAGYIKDYEGGTIMQCTMLRKVDYLQTKEILTAQREAILSKIRQKSRARTVYEPLPQFLEAPPGEAMRIDPQDVPGLRETGWTFDMAQAAPPSVINPHHSKMQQLLTDLQNHPQAWAFLTPVNGEDVVDYYDVIKKPMDFQTMEHKLSHNMYSSIEAFVADAELVFDNCLLYNPEGSVYAKNAIKLKKYLQDQLAELAKSFQ
ncbi:hypothetical protein SISNIDRAFT_410249 [Sistotremastrum niveocremeum HHB9708]|uniref:histone acetyltransferase n=1 Tax=Sistotremastrum niveocremeum HHB9708 TaxID=1314777 RepID=A0A164V9G3_9AGAM|nr:hypothetical protein SISNIDRAFT_410249 [Sistotremastrum niveocremeum HHB9708]